MEHVPVLTVVYKGYNFVVFCLQEWYYDEQDMLEMDVYDEPDPDSDYDYEEYSKRNKRRKGPGRVSGPSNFLDCKA